MARDPEALTEGERAALHDIQLGEEHLDRALGHLLAFHHEIGRGMDEFEAARERLVEEGHPDLARRLRDEVLPSGVLDDRWSFEVVEAFRTGLLLEGHEAARAARGQLADGALHVSERAQRRRWRERAGR